MRTALNLLITTGLLFLFNAFGWLTLIVKIPSGSRN